MKTLPDSRESVAQPEAAPAETAQPTSQRMLLLARWGVLWRRTLVATLPALALLAALVLLWQWYAS